MELVPNMNEIFKWNEKERKREIHVYISHAKYSVKQSELSLSFTISLRSFGRYNFETYLKCMPLQTIDKQTTKLY